MVGCPAAFSWAAAIAPYIGGLISRDTPLATTLQAMRLSTSPWPSIISITMMKAVIGACVTAARKPRHAQGDQRGRVQVAGQLGDVVADAGPQSQCRGEHPPGTPLQADSQVAMKRKGT